MKKNILFIAWVALFSLFASNSQAQSLKDLLNKDNISKAVSYTHLTLPTNREV